MTRPDVLAVFEAARSALEDARIPYALVGATGLGRFTLPRATLDLDLLVADPGRPLDVALSGLWLAERTKDVYFDQDAYLFEVPTRVTPVEMFVATHPLTRAALTRATRVDIQPFGRVPMLGLEDTIAIKAHLAAHPARGPGKRATDLADLERLLALPELDGARLTELLDGDDPDVRRLVRGLRS